MRPARDIHISPLATVPGAQTSETSARTRDLNLPLIASARDSRMRIADSAKKRWISFMAGPPRDTTKCDRTRGADTSPCFLSRGPFLLIRQLLFFFFCLFVHLLFLGPFLILLAFLSHCVPPFSVVPHLLAARAPLRRQFCLCRFS